MKKLGGSCLTDKESDDETGNTHKNFGQFITKETSKKSKDKSNYRANNLIGGIGFGYESEKTIINKLFRLSLLPEFNGRVPIREL